MKLLLFGIQMLCSERINIIDNLIKFRFYIIEDENFDENPIYHVPQGKIHITVIACISATGKVLPPYTIMSVPTGNQKEYIFPDLPGEIEINRTGWVNGSLKEKYLKWISENHLKSDRSHLILCDNHVSNSDLGVLNHAIQNNITLFTFPANLTHLLQPLDVWMFRSLKINWKTSLAWVTANKTINNQLKLKHYGFILERAYERTFLKSVIKEAWFKTDILPQYKEYYYEGKLPKWSQTTLVPVTSTTALVPLDKSNTKTVPITKSPERVEN